MNSKWRESKASTCNPALSNSRTCLNRSVLEELKKAWNLKHPDVPIKTSSTAKLAVKLQELAGSMCKNERCIVRSILGDNSHFEKMLFAPRAPKKWNQNSGEWLDSRDISSVMKLFEDAHPLFVFLGPAPIDFATARDNGRLIWDEIQNFKVTDYLKSNKTKIGLVFNTDEHDEPGEHWISMFIDLNPKNRAPFIFFLDSAGDPIPSELKALVKSIMDQCKNLDIPITYSDHGTLTHQRGENECGMYCIYMISELLKGTDPNHFRQHRVPDKAMSKCRQAFFDNPTDN